MDFASVAGLTAAPTAEYAIGVRECLERSHGASRGLVLLRLGTLLDAGLRDRAPLPDAEPPAPEFSARKLLQGTKPFKATRNAIKLTAANTEQAKASQMAAMDACPGATHVTVHVRRPELLQLCMHPCMDVMLGAPATLHTACIARMLSSRLACGSLLRRPQAKVLLKDELRVLGAYTTTGTLTTRDPEAGFSVGVRSTAGTDLTAAKRQRTHRMRGTSRMRTAWRQHVCAGCVLHPEGEHLPSRGVVLSNLFHMVTLFTAEPGMLPRRQYRGGHGL